MAIPLNATNHTNSQGTDGNIMNASIIKFCVIGGH